MIHFRGARLLVAMLMIASIIMPSWIRGAQPAAAAGNGNASINLSKTVSSTNVNPHMALTFMADHTTAIPGDPITYTATLTTGTSTLDLGGTFTALNNGNIAATISAYYDDLEYYNSTSKTWVAIAATSQTIPGYTPVVKPPTTSATFALTATPSPAGGVTYPSSGDPILKTQMATPSTATWNYALSLPLTPSLVQTLSGSNVGGMRNVVHFEVTPRATSQGQPFTSRADITDPFQSGPVAVKNITIAITPPGSPEVDFTSANTPALASLGQNASVSVSTTYTVPQAPPKGSTTSDADYLAALQALEGATLTAKATATGTTLTGPISVGPRTASTTEHVPILGITKSGPASADTGTTATYPLALSSTGGATASGLAIADTVPDGSKGTVTGVPTSLAPGGTATARATYAIPTTQATGPLTDTATLTWQDANGNSYGPVSSNYTTQITRSLAKASLKLSPLTSLDPVGATQKLVATLTNQDGSPVQNETVAFSITGPNATSGNATTDSTGSATFSLIGANPGIDTAQATVGDQVVQLSSNTSTVVWGDFQNPVSTTTVHGNFFSEDPSTSAFVAKPGDTPAFGQDFPAINFNPPGGIIAHSDLSGVDPNTRPFTDLTTDLSGGFSGTLVAQGNGLRAGKDTLGSFDAVFTAQFIVTKPSDVTFNIVADDGFVLGIGGGASRVSGTYENFPQPGTSAFQGYPVVGAFDTAGAASPHTYTETVHFPAAGSYPYELDYFERNPSSSTQQLSLVMSTASVTANSAPVSVYVGYADGVRPGGSIFPFPWLGSPGVIFEGCGAGCSYDAGAVRVVNNTTSSLTVDSIVAHFSSACTYDIWPHGVSLPANQQIITTQTTSGADNGCSPSNGHMDSSDIGPGGSGWSNNCSQSGVIPQIDVTVAGSTSSYTDSKKVLNTGGVDQASCNSSTGPAGNESASWQLIGGAPTIVDTPLPPAVTLALSPSTAGPNTVGQTQKFTAAAMDSSGQPVSGVSVALQVFGANAQQQSQSTNAQGTADFTPIVGVNGGSDTVQATGFVAGLRVVSNSVSIQWNIPVPATGGSGGSDTGGTPAQAPPAMTNVSPSDGSRITAPTPVDATIRPPSGETISSWSVSYQALDPEPPVDIAHGTGTPPSPLTTFDPTLLPNDSYSIIVKATASGGGTQTLTTTVAVAGNLKPGRYVTTYQDLNVPVDGFQMQVLRTYDSYDKRTGDFGVGWHVGLSNFRVSANRQLGAGGWVMYDTFCFAICKTAFQSTAPHYVTVTWPDGHQEIFDATPSGGTTAFLNGNMAFTARSDTNTTSTLQVDGDSSITYVYDGNLYAGDYHTLYDPHRFKLTTHDGRVLILDTQQGLISETDRNGNSLTVDSTGVHASNGESITFTRDAQRRITDIQGPVSDQHLRYGYYPTTNELQTFTNAKSNTTTFNYDPTTGNLSGVVGPDSQPVQTLQYDSSGRLSSIANGSEPPTVISTGATDRQQTFLDPNGKLTTVLTYDALGDVLERDDSFGGKTLKTTYSYDSVGRVTSVTNPVQNETNPAQPTTSIVYDESATPSNGNLLSVTDATGRQWSFSNYNSFGEPGLIQKPGGGTLDTLTYDSVTGELLSDQQPGANPTTYTYWPHGEVKSVTDPGGRLVNLAYDSNGHLISIADGLGRAVTLTPDASGQVTSVTDQLNNQTQFSYNPDGTLASMTDANHNLWQYFYDSLGRLHQAEDPLLHSSYYEYNSLGELSQRTDRNGAITNYSYDTDGLLTEEDRANNNSVTYAYDPLERLIGAEGASGHVDRTYDDSSQLQSETSCASTGTTTTPCPTSAGSSGQPVVNLNYAYFPDGRLQSVASSDAGTVQYAYDGLGRLKTIVDPAQGTFGFGYNALGQLSSLTRPNRVNETVSYNTSGDLTGRDDYQNGTLIAQFDYGIDPVTGRRTSETDLSGTSSYTYYDNGELQSATHPAGSGLANESYSYDSAGNRTSWPGVTLATYNAADRMQTDGIYNYVYDNEGDLVSKTPTGGGPGTTYRWDADHELLGITYPDGTSSSYRYDPFGRRISVLDPNQQTRIVYDGLNPHADYSSLNQLQASYLSGPGLNSALEATVGGQNTYYLQDGLGSTRALTDSSGAAVGSYSYDGFGQPASGNASTSRFTFTGYQFDPASALYYAGARYYDATNGRFLSEDPLAAANPYPYAVNDPVNLQDPTGAQTSSEYASNLEKDGPEAEQEAEVGTAVRQADEDVCTDISTANDTSIMVIGRRPDTLVAGDWPGHEIINVPDEEWSPELNDQLIQQGISAGKSFYLASNEVWANLWNAEKGRETIFNRELNQIRSAGYRYTSAHCLEPPL